MSEEAEKGRGLRIAMPANYAEWFRAGFFAALGVAALVVLLMTGRRLLEAMLDIATPFVFGMALTLVLDPVVDRLEREGMKRMAAVGLVFSLFLILLVSVSSIVMPMLVNQTGQLAANGPLYISKFQKFANDFLAQHPRVLGVKLPQNFNALTAEMTAKATEVLSGSAGHITAFLLGSITTLLETVVTLIVTFYLLLDIDRFRARLFYLAPSRWRNPMRLFATDIGRVFSDYLRGLLIVSALYGLMTLLLLLGLSAFHHEIAGYALLVAVAGGLLYAVPYLGPFVTALITFLVAFAAGGIGFGLWGILATIVLNQIFDNVITPRIVGGGVGLHPVASLFALTLGGALFGLWGLLLSVPVAASLQAILFRLFPKLTTPTPDAFLRAQGVPPDEEKSAKILQGDKPDIP